VRRPRDRQGAVEVSDGDGRFPARRMSAGELAERILLSDSVGKSRRACARIAQPWDGGRRVADLQLEFAQVDRCTHLDDSFATRRRHRECCLELDARVGKVAQVGVNESEIVIGACDVSRIARGSCGGECGAQQRLCRFQLAARLREQSESRVRLCEIALEVQPLFEGERFRADALCLVVASQPPRRVAARGQRSGERDRITVDASRSDRAVVDNTRAVVVTWVERIRTRHQSGGACGRRGARRVARRVRRGVSRR